MGCLVGLPVEDERGPEPMAAQSDSHWFPSDHHDESKCDGLERIFPILPDFSGNAEQNYALCDSV